MGNGGIFLKRITWRAALSGAAAGTINGLLGAGGGMVLVPMLIGWCGLSDKHAFATAISIILPLCIVSIVVYGCHAPLPLAESLPYLVGGAVGGVIGGLLFRRVSAGILHKLLGALILWGGIRLLV